ncbi:LuxR C-terminal-related transcriptional regulator [Actinoplanes sp. NPDC051851]|uniref:response regulator transcription factor n=1 Tax=Actinoplanes sp. NPDC051851 TaxID=3154753 RepID=UPI00341E88EA
MAELARLTCPVVVLGKAPDTDPLALIAAGARAVIGDEATELPAARAAIRSGGSYLAPSVLAAIITRDDDEDPVHLAPREVATLRCIVAGLTHREAARELGVTEQTVNTYAKRLRRKLGAANKAELTRRAAELGFVAM